MVLAAWPSEAQGHRAIRYKSARHTNPSHFGLSTAIPCREFINFTKLCAYFNKGSIKIPSKKAANIFILSILPLFLQAFNTKRQLIKLL
jgi:hypothetical protein